jgi:hypothetical protein
MSRIADHPLVVAVNTAAALITIGQFLLYVLGFAVGMSTPRLNIRLGDGTIFVLFLLVEIAVLYLVWPVTRLLCRARVPIALATPVVVIAPCYGTQVNYQFFLASAFGDFDLLRWPYVVAVVVTAIASFFIAFGAANQEIGI